MKKFLILCLSIFTLLFCFTACTNNAENDDAYKNEEGYIKLYYANLEKNKLDHKGYILKNNKDTEVAIEEILTIMFPTPEDEEYKRLFPEAIQYNSYIFDKKKLILNFSEEYSDMANYIEVLCRAAIVKTFTQLDNINYVEFTINEKPLLDSNENSVGAMCQDEFLDDEVDGEYTKYTELTLYFANESGDLLKPYKVELETTSSNISLEQLVVEQLIKGINQSGYLSTIPKDTKLLSTSVKDRVCYVDFDENFCNTLENIKDTITIYSVVNSLIELSTVNKVQFTINGEKKEMYRETIEFDGLFERRLDLIELSEVE